MGNSLLPGYSLSHFSSQASSIMRKISLRHCRQASEFSKLHFDSYDSPDGTNTVPHPHSAGIFQTGEGSPGYQWCVCVQDLKSCKSLCTVPQLLSFRITNFKNVIKGGRRGFSPYIKPTKLNIAREQPEIFLR